MISAVAENRVIGNKNSIPWHMPADFKYFKDKTLAETQQELGEFKKLLESSTVGSLVDNFRKDRDRSKHNQGTGRNIENNLNESSSIEQVNQSGSEAQKPTQPNNTVFSQANNLVDWVHSWIQIRLNKFEATNF